MTPLIVDLLAGLAAVILFVVVLWLLSGSRRVFEVSVGAPLAGRLHRAFVFIDQQRILCLAVVLSAVAFTTLALLFARLLPAIGGAIVAGAAPVYLVQRFEARRRRQFAQQLPDLMSLLAAALRSGAGLMQAIVALSADLAAPMRQEIELLLREHRLGVSFDDTLLALEQRMRGDETILFCTSLRVSHVSGGDLALLLDAMADASRQRQRIEAKIHATTAQGRLQARVMCMLPLLVAAALAVVEPGFLQPLWSTSAGLAVCAIVVVLLLVGVLLLRRIAAIDV
jgi:tight adherence protein B